MSLLLTDTYQMTRVSSDLVAIFAISTPPLTRSETAPATVNGTLPLSPFVHLIHWLIATRQRTYRPIRW